MDAHQGRVAGEIAHPQHHALLNVGSVLAFKSKDTKVTEAAGKIGFCDLTEHEQAIFTYNNRRR